MSGQKRSQIYEHGEWQVHLGRRELLARGVAVPIGARAFEIIEVLVQSANELVTKQDLMDRVWPGAAVGENTIQVHISAIRKALGQDGAMLQTVSGRGYRLPGRWIAVDAAARVEPVALAAPARDTAEPVRGNLPMAAVDLIGRTAEVRHIQDLLSAYRVVTLTGPGGIGKTTLALKVSLGVHQGFDGGVWLIELHSLSDSALVPSAVARVLGLKLGGDEITAEAVARAVGDNNVLLVLDNCEHVIDAAARLVETIVRRCPRASVLATTRELLRIDGECVYRVPPLEMPPRQQDEPEDVVGHSAVQLFVARVQALDAAFTVHEKNVRSIAAICQQLDGIPLAIEFAAARAATLGVRHVASHLEDRFRLLTCGRRTALPRHQTLRATLDWSYELLPEAERRLLGRLAIFAAGFTLEAATAVVNGLDGTTQVVLDGIANLVAKSLVTVDRSVPGGRWALLETIRAYALEKLVESGDADATARSHAMFYRGLLEPVDGSRSRPPIEDMVRHAREIDNVRAALDWAFCPVGDAAIGVILTAAYAPVWLHLSLMAECQERVARALEHSEAAPDLSAPLRTRLHFALGLSTNRTAGSAEIAGTAPTRAIEIAEALDEPDARRRMLQAECSKCRGAGYCRVEQFTAGFALGPPGRSRVCPGHGRSIVRSGHHRPSERLTRRRLCRHGPPPA
jgi:predicted ATPase/DNA-binding winged helix-turn-helix (wHTH) protein